MNRKFTLYVFHGSTPYPRRMSISLKILAVIAGFVFFSLACAGYFVHEYANLLHVKAADRDQAKAMQSLLSSQQRALVNQRAQMADVARRLNEVRDNLAVLKEFEKKIRLITDIDSRVVTAKGLGVGGDSTHDFPARLSVNLGKACAMKDVKEMAMELSSVSNEQQAQFVDLINKLQVQQRALKNTTPSIYPVTGEISSVFGYRISPFTNEWEFHKGLDISAAEGSPVVASAAGTISFAGPRNGYGNVIFIDHGRNLETRYGHLSAILRKEGDQVRKGDVIGRVGSTGESTGPHLHYEVRVNGVPVNPATYIKAS